MKMTNFKKFSPDSNLHSLPPLSIGNPVPYQLINFAFTLWSGLNFQIGLSMDLASLVAVSVVAVACSLLSLLLATLCWQQWETSRPSHTYCAQCLYGAVRWFQPVCTPFEVTSNEGNLGIRPIAGWVSWSTLVVMLMVATSWAPHASWELPSHTLLSRLLTLLLQLKILSLTQLPWT